MTYHVRHLPLMTEQFSKQLLHVYSLILNYYFLLTNIPAHSQ